MRPALLAPLTVLVALGAGPARAQAPGAAHWPVQLTYTRGAAALDCPDERGLRKAVIDELGLDPFLPTTPLQLTVRVDRRAGELVVELEERDAAGEIIWDDNTIKTRSPCRSLIKAVGLVIATRLEAEPSAPMPPAPSPPPVPVPVPVAPPIPTLPAPTPPVAPIAPKPGPPLAAGVDAIFTPFFTPSFSAGVSPWLALRPADVPLSIEVALRATWSVTPARLPVAPYRSTYTSGVLRACWRPWPSLFLCPVLEVGSVILSPTGTYGSTGGPIPSLRVAAGLGGVYERPIGEHLAVRGFADFEGLPVASPFSNEGEVRWTPSRFSCSWGLGFGIRP
jgi:hypothetical protein